MHRSRDEFSSNSSACTTSASSDLEEEHAAQQRRQFHHTQNHANWNPHAETITVTPSITSTIVEIHDTHMSKVVTSLHHDPSGPLAHCGAIQQRTKGSPPHRGCPIRLYTDAIHSILRFLKRSELSLMLQLNRQWNEWVRLLKVSYASQFEPPYFRTAFSLCRPNSLCLDQLTLQEIQKHQKSPLLRHVTAMRLSEFLDPTVVSHTFPFLQVLDIDCEFRDCQAVDMIKANKNLTSVSIGFSSTYETGLSALADAIKQHERLTNVTILGGQVDGDDFLYIAHAVASEKVNSVVLVGTGCDLNTDAAMDMATAIRTNKRLTEMTLQYLDIEDADCVAAIADSIRNHESLTYLDFSSNYFYDAGAASISSALKSNRSLTKVNLSGSFITDVSAPALAEVFKSNKNLTKLDLGNNEISDAGATCIAEAIKQSTSLTYLSLSDNQIGAAGASAIAESINQNKSICVDLRGNPISNADIALIAAGFDAAAVSTKEHPYFENQSNRTIRLFLPFVDEAQNA